MLLHLKNPKKLKDLKGPIYEFGEPGHKYAGSSNFTPQAADLKTLHGPKFEIDNGHHFSEIISDYFQRFSLVSAVTVRKCQRPF